MKSFSVPQASLPGPPLSAATIATPRAADPGTALVREYRECRDRNAPLSVLLCALDDVSPLHGSAAVQTRSALLVGLRAEIPKYLLESEWLALRGREEIMVVLPDMEPLAAELVAQKICRAARTVASSHPDALNPITVSIGIASLAVDPSSNALVPADLIRACERSLAESRRRGGNCITTTSVQWLP
jgi:GGDEF domain-containing protein